jgi:tetratricopeptide (TPR) repeat protein
MGMTQQEFLQRVNDALDPKSFFAEMGEGTVGEVTEQTSLPCPLCQTPTILNINWDLKRAACVNPQCSVHQAKPLFDIILSRYHQSPFLAALSYVGKHTFPWKGDETELFIDELETIKKSPVDSLLGALEGFLFSGNEVVAKDLVSLLSDSFQSCDLRSKNIVLNSFSRLTREFPDLIFLKESSASFRLEAKDIEGYVRDVEAISRLYINQQNEDAAQIYLEQLILHKPDHLYARETLARIYGLKGDLQEQVEHLMATIDCLAGLELFDRIQENLQLLSGLPVGDTAIGISLAEKMADYGMITEALDIYFELAKQSFEKKEQKKGEAFLEQILELAPQEEEYINQAVKLLLALGNKKACIAFRIRQLEKLSAFGLGEDALRIGKEALDQFDRDPELLRVCYNVCEEIFSPDDAIAFLKHEWDFLHEEDTKSKLLALTKNIVVQCQDAWELKEILAVELLEVDVEKATCLLMELLESDKALLETKYFSFLQLRQLHGPSNQLCYYHASLLAQQQDDASALIEYISLLFNCLQNDDQDMAIKALTKARELIPDHQLLDVPNGLVFNIQKDQEKAEACFLKHFENALQANTLNIVNEARALLETVAALSSETKRKLARWYENFGYDEFAAKEYAELASETLEDGDWEDAGQFIDQALVLNEKESEYWAVKGEIQEFIGQKKEQRECWESAAYWAIIQSYYEEGNRYLAKAIEGELSIEQLLLQARIYQGLEKQKEEIQVRTTLKEKLADENCLEKKKANFQRLLVLSLESKDVLDEYLDFLESDYEQSQVLKELKSQTDRLQKENRKDFVGCIAEKVISSYSKSIIAQEIYLDYLFLNGKNEEILIQARCYFDQHQADGNLNALCLLYKKVCDWMPLDPKTMEIHGDYQSHVENIEEAVSLWDEAIKVFSENGDSSSVVRVMEKKTLAFPDSLSDKEFLACLYVKNDQKEKAIEVFSSLIDVYYEERGAERLESLVDSCIVSLEGDWEGFKRFVIAYEEVLGTPASHDVVFLFVENALLTGKTSAIVDACHYLLSFNGLRSELAEQCAMFLVQFSDKEKAAEIYRQLIIRYEFDNNLDEALRLCENAREILPDDDGLKVIWYRLKLTQRNAKDEVYVETVELYHKLKDDGKWNLAADLAELLCQAMPEKFQWFIALGEAKYHSGSVGEGSAILRTFARDKATDNYPATRGALEKFISLFDDHQNELEKLIVLIIEKGDKIPLYLIEEKLYYLKEAHESEPEFSVEAKKISALAEDPISAEALYLETLYDIGYQEKAKDELELLAKSLEDNDSLAEAFLLYEKLCLWSPENIIFQTSRATLADKVGEKETAFIAWRSLVDLFDADGSREDLIFAAEKALLFDGEDRQVRLLMAEALYEDNQEEKSKEAFWEIVHQNGKDELFEANISTLQQIKGYFEDPQHRATLELARVYSKIGCDEEARKEWKYILDQTEKDNPLYIKYAQEAHLAHRNDEYLWGVYLHSLKELGDYSSFVTEAKGLVSQHLQQNEFDLAMEILEDACQGLIECREFVSVSSILEEFSENIKGLLKILRFKALAFEGQEKDVEASSVWTQLADLYIKEDHHEDAVNALRRAVALTPSNIDLRQDLVEMLKMGCEVPTTDLLLEYSELARVLGPENSVEKISIYKEMLEIDDENLSLLKNICELYFEMGEENTAIPYLVKYGSLALSLGMDDKADEIYNQVIQLDPENSDALKGLMVLSDRVEDIGKWSKYTKLAATVYEKENKLNLALELWRQVASRAFEDVELLEKLASLELHQGNMDEAKIIYAKLLNLYMEKGSLEEKVFVLEQLVLIDSNDTTMQAQLGAAYFDVGEEEKAGRLIKKTLHVHYENKEWDVVLDLCEKYPEIFQNDINSLDSIAQAYENSNQPKKAGFTRYQRSCLHQENGEDELELIDIEEALRLNPEIEDAYLRLINIYYGVQARDKMESIYILFIKYSLDNLEKTKTKNIISDAMEKCNDSIEIVHLASSFYVDFGEKGKAIEILWKAIQDNKSQRPRAVLDLLKIMVELDLTLPPIKLALEIAVELGDQKEKLYFGKLLTVRIDPFGDEGDIIKAHEAYLSSNPTDANSLDKVVGYYCKENKPDLAFGYILEGGKSFLNEGDVEAAGKLFTRMKTKLQFTIKNHLQITDIYMENDIPELAIKEYMDLAMAYKGSSNNKEALFYLDKALSILPSHFNSNKEMYSILVQIKDFDHLIPIAQNIIYALRDRQEKKKEYLFIKELLQLKIKDSEPYKWLEEYVVRAPQEADLIDDYRILADKYKQSGKVQKAEHFLDAALAIVPDHIDTLLALIEVKSINETNFESAPYYLRLAKAYDSQGILEKAKNILEFLIEREYEKREVFSLYLKVLLKENDQENAYLVGIDLADELIELDTEKAEKLLAQIKDFQKPNGDYLRLTACVHRNKKSHGIAIQIFEEAIKLYENENKLNKAIDVSQEILKLDPVNLSSRRKLIEFLLAQGGEVRAVKELKELARVYEERGLIDLSFEALNQILTYQSDNKEIWQKIFSIKEASQNKQELIVYYLKYADILSDLDSPRDSIDYYLKVIEIEARNLDGHRGYISQYPKIGKPIDIVDGILAFAQILLEEGHVDESLQYFELVMSLDPSNELARDILSSTQSKESKDHELLPDILADIVSGEGRILSEAPSKEKEDNSEFDLSDTQQKMISRDSNASDILMGTLDRIEMDETKSALLQIEQNYRDILSVNPQNGNVRVRLADVLGQLGRKEEMLTELSLASEIYLVRDELANCAEACQKYLKVNPTSQQIRKRLNDAVLKRDAFKALESAILFTDRNETNDTQGRKTTDG